MVEIVRGASMKLEPGTTLQSGKYLLNQALGEEGFGITYLATQTFSNQAVVIKTLDASLQVTRSFPQLHQRFVEETRLLARSQHPSIVRVLDFFQEGNLPFLVMEHVPGKTLAETVKTRGALPEAEAVHYIRQIGSAIDTAHRNGLIHRNLNPRSIIRRPGTHLAVLVGFGIAHEVAGAVSPAQANVSAVDEFALPDRLWADNRFAIDLYGLSATLYYLLSARAPGLSFRLNPKWNPALKQAILSGMTSDLTHRPATIAAWLHRLPSKAVPLQSATAIAAPLPGQSAQKEAAVEEPVFESEKQISPTVDPSLPVLPKRELAKMMAEDSDRSIGSSAPIRAVQPHPVQQSSPTAPKPVLAFTTRKLAFMSTTVPLEISRHFPRFVGLTSAAALSIGVCFGLALRFSAARSPGASFFHPNQAFPVKDWQGTLTPQADGSGAPIEKSLGGYDRSAPPRSAPSASELDSAPPAQATAADESVASPIQRSTLPRSTATESAPAIPVKNSDLIPTVPAPSGASPDFPTPAPAKATDPMPPLPPSTATRKPVVVPTPPEDSKL